VQSSSSKLASGVAAAVGIADQIQATHATAEELAGKRKQAEAQLR
jgi:hypothetical protein